MIIFVYHAVPPCEVSEGIVSLYQLFYPSVCHWTIRPLTFTEKSAFDKIKLMLSTIGIITIVVDLLQMIQSYVTSFVVCQFLCLVCIFESHLFQILMVLCYICFILVGPGVPVNRGKLAKGVVAKLYSFKFVMSTFHKFYLAHSQIQCP